MFDFTKTFFTGQPLRNPIADDAQIIFVADFFANELSGGAEFTGDAIFKKCPYKFQQIKSQNLTIDILNSNQDRYWIFGNFSALPPPSLVYLMNNLPSFKYAILEFDFKYCIYRSPFKHFMQNQGKVCECPSTEHSKIVTNFYAKADKMFWMSEKQKEHYTDLFPSLNSKEKNIVQSSTFNDETLMKLAELRESNKSNEQKTNKVWMIQNSDSWIKGTNEAVSFAKRKGLNYKLVGSVSYDQFLDEMAKSYGFICYPVDSDTCPRTVIEAKLLGIELELNSHVLHKDESWFNSSIEKCEEYMKTRADSFWSNIKI